MKKKTFILLPLIMFFLIKVDAQTTITLQPNSVQGKDALLYGLSSEVNNNYGNNSQLAANAWTFSGTPGVVRSALEFDLSSIPTGSTINSAYLSLYAWDSNSGFGQHSTMSGSNDCLLKRITSSWDENTVTWNTQPTTTNVNQVSIPTSTSPTQNYLNIDVSNLVQDMIDNISSSHGFLMQLQNESFYRLMNFASSDHTNNSLHPKLTLTYTIPTPSDTCITLQPNSDQGKDALLHGLSSEVNNNYGSNSQLAANAWIFSGTSGVVRGALEFDLSSIPAGSTINSAYLSLYAWDSNSGFGQHSTMSGSNDCLLKRITSSWDENTVTWNTQPTTTNINQVSIPASTSPTENYLNIDVSNLVQDMIDNISSSHGFLMQLQNESFYRLMNFASSDHINNSLHPKIEICYSLNATSVQDIPNNNIQFKLYPNPANDILNIAINGSESENFLIEIFNSQSQLVKSLLTRKSFTSVNTSTMAKGLYYLRVKSNQNVSTQKLLIK